MEDELEKWLSEQLFRPKNQNLPKDWEAWKDLILPVLQDPRVLEQTQGKRAIAQRVAAKLRAKIEGQMENQARLEAEMQTALAPLTPIQKLDLQAFFGKYWDSICEQMPSSMQEDLGFYQAQRVDLLLRQDEQGLQRLRHYIETQWQGILQHKHLEQAVAAIDGARRNILLELYNNIQQFETWKQALEGLESDLGRLWDLSDGQWQTGSQAMQQQVKWLAQQDLYKLLARLLGRLEASADKLENLDSGQNRKRRAFKPARLSERVGLRRSNDLHNLLPSALVQLAEPHTEALFFRDFLEHKLLTYEQKQKQKEAEGLDSGPNSAERGPIILCLDTSGSMRGEPEQLAKALSLALLRLASKQGRACFLIAFSVKLQVLDLSKIKESLERLLNFMNYTFYGGTDLGPALQRSLEVLEQEEAYAQADVLVVSDFVMGPLSFRTEEGLAQQKERGTRFHALSVGDSGNEAVLRHFSARWPYDPSNPESLGALLQALRQGDKKLDA